MRDWLVFESQLTPDQLRAVRLSPDEHRVIMGGPGSGKTQVLLYRARHLCDTYRTPADRFRIFVFTRALKSYISSALDLLGLQEDCITTLAWWCYYYYKENVHPRVPTREDGTPDFPWVVRRLIEEMRFLPAPLYDFALVDEGQDLDEDSYRLLKLISKHITVCVDQRQQIYEHGSDVHRILTALGVEKPNVSLLETFRCCPYITRLTAELLDDPREREFHRRRAHTVQVEREVPLLYIASDFEDEKRHLHEVLRQRVSRGESVAILVPQRKQAYGFARGLLEAGFDVEAPPRMGDFDFKRATPKVMPYHSAKGLMFDSVLMPRLTTRCFRPYVDSTAKRLVFVAIARAVKWAYLSTVEGQEPSIVNHLRGLEKDGIIAVRRSGCPGNAQTTTEPDDEDELFD